MDLTSAAIATLVSGLVNTVVTLNLFRRNDEKRLNDQLHDIIKLSVEYPYLEDKKFTNQWNTRNPDDERYTRYDNYCALVFNFLERLFEHYKYDVCKIEKFMDVKSWIRLHRHCWECPSTEFENTDGYDPRFRSIITEFLK